jgi:hypothetical protein
METILTGNSSIELNRTSKGQYSYSIKLYFDRIDKRTLMGIIDKVMMVKQELEERLEGEDLDLESSTVEIAKKPAKTTK